MAANSWAWQKITKLLLNEDAYCVVCGTNVDLTVDHITPRSRGGEDTLDNAQVMCRRHNSSKGNRPMSRTSYFSDLYREIESRP